MEIDKANTMVNMIKQAIMLKGIRALEIGCGEGTVTSSLAKEVGYLLAIDPDFQAIRIARSKLKDVGLLIGSGEDLAFKDESFDLVLFTHSLHHQDSNLALKETHRVLKPSGQVIVIEPLVKGAIQQLFNIFNDETEALRQANQVIKTSSFSIQYQREFTVTWKFEHFNELLTYFFTEHRVETNDKDIKRIKDLLGPIQYNTPILLPDKVIFFVLPKRQ
jgi:ubiquinone/menaquinone biosynthesis C-methylase UbiE